MRNYFQLLLVLLFPIISLYGNNNHSISGKITYPQGTGTIFIRLVNENQFKNYKGGIDSLALNVTMDNHPGKYHFKNIPDGEYAIIAFFDINNNKKLDMGFLQPKEPWGMSWKGKHYGPPRFKQCCIKLKSNKYIDIHIK